MKWIKRIVLVLAVLLVLAQFVRPSLSNPPVDPSKTLAATGTLPPQVGAIFDRSCNDCHSNQTVWPWYAQVAPVSWLLADHIKDGRAELNVSTWATYQDRRKVRKLQEICDEVKEGAMPLKSYLPLHPSARLSDSDRQTICSWTSGQIAAFASRGITAPPRRPQRP